MKTYTATFHCPGHAPLVIKIRGAETDGRAHRMALNEEKTARGYSLVRLEQGPRVVLGCEHQWGIDGAHSNQYCKKCFVTKPTGSTA